MDTDRPKKRGRRVNSLVVEKEESHMNKILEGDALEQRAREIGVDTQGGPITQRISGRHKRLDDYELHKRVIEAERSILR